MYSSSMHIDPFRRTTKSIPGLVDRRSRGLLIHVTVMVETPTQGTSLFDTVADTIHVSYTYRVPLETGIYQLQ